MFQEQLNRYERAIYASLSGNLKPVIYGRSVLCKLHSLTFVKLDQNTAYFSSF